MIENETMDVKQIVEDCLKSFPLYDQKHKVGFIKNWIGYRTTDANRPEGTTHFDLNLCGDTLYLLSIEIEKQNRGKGNGESLYKVIEEIGKRLGCTSLNQTPSGWTQSGDTRANYLKRRGYEIIGGVAIKKLD